MSAMHQPPPWPLDTDPLNAGALRDIRRRVNAWFRRHQRPLPWREHYDPYAVWISEIMLQQTQVATVLPYFERWMRRFPDVQALARAPLRSVLKAWEGLGYYARARNLHRAARIVTGQLGGRLPRDPQRLRELPGIGPYSAGAIASIAFNGRAAAVDGNVARVLCRLWALPWPWRSAPGQQALWALAERLLPPRGARTFNQGLMELGALVCREQRPACERCPLRSHCRAYHAHEPEAFPVKSSRTPPALVRGVMIVLMHEGRLALRRCPESGLWGGLWEFPWAALQPGESRAGAARRLLAALAAAPRTMVQARWTLRHTLTHMTLELQCRVYVAAGPAARQESPRDGVRWVSRAALRHLPVARIGHKVLEEIHTRGLW